MSVAIVGSVESVRLSQAFTRSTAGENNGPGGIRSVNNNKQGLCNLLRVSNEGGSPLALGDTDPPRIGERPTVDQTER